MQPAERCGGESGRLENGDAHLVRGVGGSSVGGSFRYRHCARAGRRCDGGTAGKSTSNGPGDAGEPAGDATDAAGEPAGDGRHAAGEPAGTECGNGSDRREDAGSAAVLGEGGKVSRSNYGAAEDEGALGGDLLHHGWVDADDRIDALCGADPDYGNDAAAGDCRESEPDTHLCFECGVYAAAHGGCGIGRGDCGAAESGCAGCDCLAGGGYTGGVDVCDAGKLEDCADRRSRIANAGARSAGGWSRGGAERRG
jgi:hypothetical protein